MEKIAFSLIDKLNDSGFKAFIVGGAVRNKLLHKEIKDYDIATNASPNEIKKVFDGYQFVESGIKHGTVGVIVDGIVYEITTFRKDGDYVAHRKPEKVEFVNDLKEDLSRRDFTINALAYDSSNNIVDYFGGVDDLNNGLLRAVGDPKLRFTEDALRILRGVRFCSQYGFDIEKNTLNAMISCKKYLKDVSKERIFNELNQAVCGDYVSKAFYICKEILFEVIGELKKTDGCNQYSLSHDYDVYNHTLAALKYCKCRKPSIMWALLFHDIGKPDCLTFDKYGYGHTKGHMERSYEITKPILKRLKFPNKLSNDVLQLVIDHDRQIDESKYCVKKYISEHGIELTYDLYYLKVADNLAHSSYGTKRFVRTVKQLKYYLDEIELNQEITNIDQLNIDGNDLLSLGIKGEMIGKIKLKLFDLVLSNKLINDKKALINYAKSIM